MSTALMLSESFTNSTSAVGNDLSFKGILQAKQHFHGLINFLLINT